MHYTMYVECYRSPDIKSVYKAICAFSYLFDSWLAFKIAFKNLFFHQKKTLDEQ